MAGVTPRTLRYYDQIGLLSPKEQTPTATESTAQRMLTAFSKSFYRELGVSLEDIRKILTGEDFDELSALQSHLSALLERREQLNLLISNLEKPLKRKKEKYL